MTLSIWRFGHLALAIVSSVFLLILSITGVILAYDAVAEKTPNYQVENFDSLTLAQTIPALRKVYPEILELNVDHNKFVSIEAINEQGESVKAYINPHDGSILGELKPKSQFIQWITALHRSLFLKDTGRIIIGLTSFILFLITCSGIVLIIKRQQGIRHFFDQINRDFLAQYFHVVSGRIFLIPILLLSLTGTYLSMDGMNLLPKENQEIEFAAELQEKEAIEMEEFAIFQQTKLADVQKIEFPFMEDDPDEFFLVKLKGRELLVNQINGELKQEVLYPFTILAQQISLDLHTGRSHILLAIVLGLASLNILFFIYSGFVITWKRTRVKIRNKFNSTEAEIILLVGSENGSTLFFANQIHKQLLADGQKSFLCTMNQYGTYPKAAHMIVFTSTFGLGNAPSNALNFESLLQQFPQQQQVHFSVVGFGSKAYEAYCGYAIQVDDLLNRQLWTKRFTELYCVNDRSIEEFILWVQDWTEKSLYALASAPSLYQEKPPKLQQFKVLEKTQTTTDNSTFKVILKPNSKIKFESGDLLAIYPAQDHRERLYSVSAYAGKLQLMVKLHPHGLGSGFLDNLQENELISGRILENPHFHFPKKVKQVAMIANGTGIAPFLGMIMSNKQQVPIQLYAGFRKHNGLTEQYLKFSKDQQALGQLKSMKLAFSREENRQYVMDLIRQDAAYFVKLFQQSGVIMICGSLRMQQDVELVLDEILKANECHSIAYFKNNNQVLTDCY